MTRGEEAARFPLGPQEMDRSVLRYYASSVVRCRGRRVGIASPHRMFATSFFFLSFSRECCFGGLVLVRRREFGRPGSIFVAAVSRWQAPRCLRIYRAKMSMAESRAFVRSRSRVSDGLFARGDGGTVIPCAWYLF